MTVRTRPHKKENHGSALGTVGLYGIINYSLSHRTREIGVRMALGAQRRDVTSLVLGEGMLVILIGLAIGLAGSLVLTIFLPPRRRDRHRPAYFCWCCGPLGTCRHGSMLYTRPRAIRVDPMVALRYE